MSDDFRDNELSPSTLESNKESNKPAYSSQEVLQRTASAISPWIRRWWSGDNSSGASATPAVGVGRVPGQFPVALRVQRSVARSAQPGHGGELTDRFSNSIVQRHVASEQIERRYRTETRQVSSPAPAQLPLPGVSGAGGGPRVQRAGGEMSLDELARSFQASAAASAAQADIQRSVEESEASRPVSFAEMQEAIRRAAQSQPVAPAAATDTPTVQRSAQPDAPKSLTATIDERIRQAREAQEAQRRAAAKSAAPTPAASPAADAVQRAPVRRLQASPADPSTSVASAIQERIRQAREGGGQSAPAASYPVPVAPVQRAVEPEPVEPEEVPRELPLAPVAEPDAPGFSIAAALDQRIQAKRGQVSPLRLPSSERAQLPSDPASSEPSLADRIQERIQRARLHGPEEKPELSTDPDSPHFSRAEAIRNRIEQNRLQRAAAPVAPATSEGAPGIRPPVEGSVADMIRARLEAARAGVEPPAAPSAETVQRAPADERPPVMRDFRPAPQSPSLGRTSPPPQAKRVRALSRSQVLTPERKTGNFLAGEEPKGKSTPPMPSSVQRTIDVSPARVTSTEAPVQRSSSSPATSALSVPSASPSSAPSTAPSGEQSQTDSDSDDHSAALVQRSSLTAPVQQPPERAAPEINAAISSDMPVAIPVQRLPIERDATVETVSSAPTMPNEPAPNAPTASESSVQRTVETSPPPITPQAAPPALDAPVPRVAEVEPAVNTDSSALVQRTPDEPARQAIAPAILPSQTSAQPAPPATESVQRTPDRAAAPRDAVDAAPALAPPVQSTVQRVTASDTPVVRADSASAALAASAQPAALPVQRTPAPDAPGASTPVPVEQPIQRSADVTPALPIPPASVTPTPTAPVTPVVQRTSEDAGTTPAESSANSAPPVQRSVESAARTVRTETRTETHAVADATPAAAPPATQAAAPAVQRAVETTPSTPAQRSPVPSIQRSAVDESHDSATVEAPVVTAQTPTAPLAQRSPASAQNLAPAPSTPGEPPVQRTFDAATPASSPVIDIPVTDSSGAEPTVAPVTPAPDAPREPDIQRATQAPGSAPPAALPALPAVESVARAAATAPVAPSQERVQRTPEPTPRAAASAPSPAVDTAATATQAAPATVQRTPADPSADLSAPIDSSPQPRIAQSPAQSPAQATPPLVKSPAATPIVQRTSEDAAALPASIQGAVSETQGQSVAPSSTPSAPVASSTSVPVVQRTPVENERAAPATPTAAPASIPAPQPVERIAPASSPVQRTPVESEPDSSTPSAAFPEQPSQLPVVTTAAIQRQPEESAPATPSTPTAPSTPPAASVQPALPVQRMVDDASVPAALPDRPVESAPPNAPAITPPTVQRTAAVAASPAAISPVAPTATPVQRVTEPNLPTPPTSTQSVAAAPEPASQTVQRTAEEVRGPVATTDAPQVQREPEKPAPIIDAPAVDAPAVVTPAESAPPTVQRTPAESSSAAPVTSAMPVQRITEPAEIPTPTVQRSPVDSERVTDTPTPVAPVDTVQGEPPVQRLPEIAIPSTSPSATSTPPTVQRVPAESGDVDHSIIEVAPVSSAPSSPPVQRASESVEPTTSATAAAATPAETAGPTVQRTPAESSSATAAPVTSAPPVQRTTEPAETTTPTVQRSPVDSERATDAPTPVASVEKVQGEPPVQRLPETLAPPTSTPTSSTPPLVQRAPAKSGDVDHSTIEVAPVSSAPSSPPVPRAPVEAVPTDLPVQRSAEPASPALPPIERAPDTSVSPAEPIQRMPVDPPLQRSIETLEPAIPAVQAPEATPTIQRISRQRDPRLLARKPEQSHPRSAYELPLRSNATMAVLPQARLAGAPAGSDVVQRMEAGPQPTPGAMAPMSIADIQRALETNGAPVLSGEQARVRFQSGASRANAKVQRSPLPLAKLRVVPSKQTVQRDDTPEQIEGFVGPTQSTQPSEPVKKPKRGLPDIPRTTPLPETRKKKPTDVLEPDIVDDDELEIEQGPNLDVLARAIVPMVKRMLAIERERRSYR